MSQSSLYIFTWNHCLDYSYTNLVNRNIWKENYQEQNQALTVLVYIGMW